MAADYCRVSVPVDVGGFVLPADLRDEILCESSVSIVSSVLHLLSLGSLYKTEKYFLDFREIRKYTLGPRCKTSNTNQVRGRRCN